MYKEFRGERGCLHLKWHWAVTGGAAIFGGPEVGRGKRHPGGESSDMRPKGGEPA